MPAWAEFGHLPKEEYAGQSQPKAQRCSGILKVKHVSSGVDVTSIVPPCALAISEAM